MRQKKSGGGYGNGSTGGKKTSGKKTRSRGGKSGDTSVNKSLTNKSKSAAFKSKIMSSQEFLGDGSNTLSSKFGQRAASEQKSLYEKEYIKAEN